MLNLCTQFLFVFIHFHLVVWNDLPIGLYQHGVGYIYVTTLHRLGMKVKCWMSFGLECYDHIKSLIGILCMYTVKWICLTSNWLAKMDYPWSPLRWSQGMRWLDQGISKDWAKTFDNWSQNLVLVSRKWPMLWDTAEQYFRVIQMVL